VYCKVTGPKTELQGNLDTVAKLLIYRAFMTKIQSWGEEGAPLAQKVRRRPNTKFLIAMAGLPPFH
jgi:hypothetical protein